MPSAQNLEAREEFSRARLGIFIHWGIYSMLGDGEWVSLFKEAGAGYVTVTSRHHDGFSMFKTDASTYNIVDATPFKRDVIGELAEACHKEGLKIHLYYSQLDWGRGDYLPLGSTGQNAGRLAGGDLPDNEQ